MRFIRADPIKRGRDRADPLKGAATVKGIFHRQSFVMGSILCSMQSRDQHCSTRDETGSETVVEQLSQQAMIASSTIPLELCDDYSMPYDNQDLQNVQEMLCKETVNDEDEDIVISEKAARAIKGEAEYAFLGEEFNLYRRNQTSNLRRRSDV